MEVNNQKSGNTGLGILIGALLMLVLCLGGYFVYNEFISKNSSNSNNELNNSDTNKKDEVEKVSYKLEEYGSCEKLYINGVYTDFIGQNFDIKEFNDLLLVNGNFFSEEICSQNSEINFIPNGDVFYAFDKTAKVVAVFAGSDANITKYDQVIKVKGKWLNRNDNYQVNGKSIIFESDNTLQDDEAVACNSRQNNDVLVWKEEFTYLGNNKFSSSKVLEEVDAKTYISNKSIICR